ncbi:hypothetical protein H4R99_004810 [Coemansia sp. RSA 1722]|nr:hypothetical protein H4R99_004810 [Coemansia sp. RSA 1722]
MIVGQRAGVWTGVGLSTRSSRHLSSSPQLQPLPEETEVEQQPSQQPYKHQHTDAPGQSGICGLVIKQGKFVAATVLPDNHVSKTAVNAHDKKITTLYNNKHRWLTNKYQSLSQLRTALRPKQMASKARCAMQSALEAFLPADYRTSVTSEYFGYMKWQFVHNTLGSASGVLATQAMLYAMGLGAGALPLSAALNWVIKDGVGQLGGVFYATVMGQKFDSDPKHLRFWSAVWLQLSTWLEMLTPLAPHLFLPIGCIANVGKNISWLAMSATKAAINKSFCLTHNLGDLTAKHGSQATAAGLLGTAAGVIVGATVDLSFYTLIVGFVPISLASLWANYKSLMYTVTPTLNVERARGMIQDAVNINNTDGQLMLDPGKMKTPREVSVSERFMRNTRCFHPEHMFPGIVVSFDIGKIHKNLARKPLSGSTAVNNNQLANMVENAFYPSPTINNMEWTEKYYVGYLAGCTLNRSRNGNVYLWFSTQATTEDMLLGLYHAAALRLLLADASGNKQCNADDMFGRAYRFARLTFADFVEAVVMSGWDTTTVYFGKKADLVQVEQISMQTKQ